LLNRRPAGHALFLAHFEEDEAMRTMNVVLLTLFVGAAVLPAAAGELCPARHGSNVSVMAFLSERGLAARGASKLQLAACKGEGAKCSTDGDCCSGECRHAGDAGHICVSK
jgi:hypothetical protein